MAFGGMSEGMYEDDLVKEEESVEGGGIAVAIDDGGRGGGPRGRKELSSPLPLTLLFPSLLPLRLLPSLSTTLPTPLRPRSPTLFSSSLPSSSPSSSSLFPSSSPSSPSSESSTESPYPYPGGGKKSITGVGLLFGVLDFDFDFDFFLPSVGLPSFFGLEVDCDSAFDIEGAECVMGVDLEVEGDSQAEYDEDPLLTSGAVVYSDSDASTSASVFEDPAITEPVALGTTTFRPSPTAPIEPNANGIDADAAFVRLLPLMIALSSNAPLSSDVGERTMGGDLVAVVFVLVPAMECVEG